MKRCQKDLAQFLADMPAWCRATRNEIPEWKGPGRLLLGWRKSLKPVFVRTCQVLRTVIMVLSRPASELHQELSGLVGDADANALLSNRSGASGDLACLKPLLGLAQAAKGTLSREAYLERYGHRGPHEMELFAPGAEDDLAWFENQLAQFTQAPVDVEAHLAKQRAEQAAAWGRFEARFPEKAPAFQRRLEQIATAAKNREAVRSERTRLARLIRAFLLQAGAVTGMGDEVFFLSLDELAGGLAGDKTALPRLPGRRKAYQKYCALPPYPAIIIGNFDPVVWAADPGRRSDIFDTRRPRRLFTALRARPGQWKASSAG
jgi:hypothetical protein